MELTGIEWAGHERQIDGGLAGKDQLVLGVGCICIGCMAFLWIVSIYGLALWAEVCSSVENF